MAYLDLSGVCKEFASQGQRFTALEGVDLQVDEGEFVSLIGHSGCGKSTVLSLVAGLEQVTRGAIRVGGALVRGPGPDRMVAFQNHSLLPWLTMRQNIQLAVDQVHRAKSPSERSAIVQEHLEMVNLTKAADRLPGQVSGGMKQRCGIARALSTRPKVLLLDEPFGALDAMTRASLQDELARIWEKARITVLMITHDVDEALLLSDRIAMMSNGPAARVAEIMKVDLARPRSRLEVVNHPSYYRQRGELIYFLNKSKRAKNRRGSSLEALPPGPAPVLASGVEKEELVVGFVPLLDCAPFAVAEAEGFFERNNLKVTLSREPSWRAIADGLREGRLDAAQMVAGMPIAETLGLGGRQPWPVCAAVTLSRGGNAITLGRGLRESGATDAASLKRLLAERSARGNPPLIFGMVHPASMHNLLLRAWLAAAGIDPDLDLTMAVVPPPQMVANLEQGNIAGFCVGEPWNTRAVRAGLGFVPVTDAGLWPTHPEKVLGVSAAWAERYPRTHVALVSALLSACALCDEPSFRTERLPRLLAEKRYVGGEVDDFAAALGGPFDFGEGRRERIDDLVLFSRGGANLCRTGESLWILAQLARWGLVAFPEDPGALLARIYLEGVAREAATATGIALGDQVLEPIAAPPGHIFDPRAPLDYLGGLAIRRDGRPPAAPAAVAAPALGAAVPAAPKDAPHEAREVRS